ncbi:hypothetical protein KW076_01680 [Micrococcus porci]|uniref:hypothetical protein n=1 Tax=Micrococcus porci TaxID=2856555 RepID=UPI001CCFAA3B|nr:hypothetical protein [Micrococcus porci]UBH24937.1 hypothetical protein KW076_01680 [Micrococcus porci]
MTIQYDSAAAAAYEDEVLRIASRIETILGDREQQKRFVADNYQSTDNDADYDVIEQTWLEAGQTVKELVDRARTLMEENDEIAAGAHQKAGNHIAGMRA